MTDEEVWMRAYCHALTSVVPMWSGETVEWLGRRAKAHADQALKDYRETFHPPKDPYR